MFQSLGFLQHYIEVNTRIIVSLEKLLSVGSYGGYINHLTCHHAILFASSCGLGLPFVVWIIAPTLLGCWALIVLILVIHFQHDDHTILLDVVAHVETNTF
jgi:hypothetical protein